MKTQSTLRALLLGVSFLAAPCIQGATYYWDTDGATAGSGGVTPSGTWSTGGTTWTTDSTGTTATSALTTTFFDDLFFSAGTDATGAYAVSLNSTTQNARLVTFEDGTATLTAATGTLSLGTGGGIMVTTNTVTGSTISTNLTISGSQTFNVAAGRTLTLDTGTFTRNAGATLNILSTGTVTTTMTGLDSASLVNGIIGPWASFGSGASTSYATINGSNDIVGLGYTGGADGVTAAASTNVVTGGGNLNYTLGANGTLGASANINTLRYTLAAGGTLTTSTAFTTNGIMNTGGGTLTFAGSVTSGTGEMVLNAANGNITLAGLVNSGNLVTVTGSGTVTYSATGTFSGLGGLTMNGSGLLNFQPAGANVTYSGTTTLNAGTLQVNNNLPGGNLTMNGGSLKLYFGSSMIRALGSGVGQIQIIGGASGFDGNNGACTVNFGNAGAEVQWGSTFFNPTSLRFQDTAGGSGVNDRITFVNALDLNGASRTIANNSATGGPVTFSGLIRTSTGTAGLIKTGVGAMNLTNASNSYNGATTITQGTLNANSSGALGSASNTLVFNGGTFQAGAAFNSVSTRGVTMTSTGIIDTNTFALGILGNIGGAGGLTKNSTGTLTLSGTNTYGGVTTVNAGTLQFTNEVSLVSNTAANLNVKSGATLALNVGGAGQFTATTINSLLTNISVANTAAQGLQAGAILGLDTTGGTFTQGNAITNSTGASGGSIGLTKLGTGILVLDKANTYTGVTTITTGTLQLGSGIGTGSLSGSGIIGIGTGATFAVNQTDTVIQGTEFGFISGLGSFIQAGSGTTVLNQANTFSGTTTVSAGTLSLSNALAIQNSALVTTGAGTVTLGAGVTTPTFGGLSGTTGNLATIISNYNTVTALTLNPLSGSVTYGGVIANSDTNVSLTKTGAGTQILTGANTYTGLTTIQAGTLTIGNATTGSLNGTAGTALTFGGTGTFIVNEAASSTQGMGLLTFSAGDGTVQSTFASTAATLTFSNVAVRTAGATGNFIQFGGAATTNKIVLTQFNGAATPTGALLDKGLFFGGSKYAAYDLTNGTVRAYASGDIGFVTSIGGVNAIVDGATTNVELTTAGVTGQNTAAINTLNLTSTFGVALNANQILTVNGILKAGGNASTGITMAAGTGGIRAANNAEMVIRTDLAGDTLLISANILANGTNTLTKSGLGILRLTGTNTFTGGLVINGGTVGDNTGALSNAALNNNNITINANSSIGFGATTVTNGGINLNNGSVLSTGSNNSSVTINGAVTGNGGLSIIRLGDGSNTFNLNSTGNNFTGGIDYNSSRDVTVNVRSFADSGAYGAGNIRFAVGNPGTQNHRFTLASGAIAPLTINNRQFELTSAGSSYTAFINNDSNQTFTINSDLLVSGTNAKALTLGGTGTGLSTFAGKISNGTLAALSLTKAGTGTWSLSSIGNTFTGAITLNSTTTSAGILSYASAGGANPITFLQTTSTATLNYTGSGQTMSGAITASALTTGTITLAASGSGSINYSNTGSLGVAGSGIKNLILSGTNTDNNILAGQWVNNTGAAATLTKADVGTWVITGANSYTGTTTVNAGTLVLDMTGSGALAATSALTLGGGNFRVKGGATSAQTLGALTLSASTNSTITLDPNNGTSTTLTLGNAWTRNAGSSLLIDYSSSNTGTRQVVTAGATTGYILSNGIYGGILVKDSAGVTGFATRAAGATQAITRYDDTTGTTLVDNSNVAGTNFTTLNTVYTLGTLNWNNVITTRSVNSLTIDTTNNGGTIDMGVSGNILTLTSGAILFKGPNNMILTGGQVGAAASEVVVHQTGGGSLTINSLISSGAGSLTKDGSGTLILGATNTYTGQTTVSAGALTFAGNSSGTLGSIQVGGAGTATLNIEAGTYTQGAGGFRVGTNGGTGTVNQSGGAVTWDSTSLQLLIGNLGFAGTYNLSGGSLTTLTGTNTRGVMLGVNNNSTATFNLSGTGNLTVAGTSRLMIGRSDSAMSGTVNLFAQTGGTATISDLTIGGPSGGASGANSTLSVTAGTFTAAAFSLLSAGVNDVSTINIGGTAVVTLPNLPTLRGSGATATLNFDGGTLRNSATGTFITGLTNAFIQDGGAQFDTTLNSTTISQNLLTHGTSLGGGLIKIGINALTLTGTNTYTGATTVSDGTLLVNGSISSSSLTTVASGATIGGSGTVGALTVSSGGFINTGNGPTTGILNTGNYSQAGLYTVDIGGLTAGTQHDQINVTGTVNITGGSLTVMFTGGSYTNGDLIFILLSGSGITGEFSGFANGATVLNDGTYNWNISYFADSGTTSFTGGNDIALQAVLIPEPKTALLGCLGILLLLRRRRN